MIRRNASAVALGLIVAGIYGASVEAESDKQGPPPMLDGQWTLDREQSELPRFPGHQGAAGEEDSPPPEGMNGGRGDGFGPPPGGGMGGRGPGGMGGFGGGRGGPGGGFGGSRPSPAEMAAVRSMMRSVMNPPLEMQIIQSEKELVVQDANGVLSRLALDGRKVKSNDGAVSRTRWNKGQLVEEVKVAWIKIKRAYALVDTDSGQRLILAINVQDDRAGSHPRSYRCVYARSAAATAPALLAPPSPTPPPPTAPPSEESR